MKTNQHYYLLEFKFKTKNDKYQYNTYCPRKKAFYDKYLFESSLLDLQNNQRNKKPHCNKKIKIFWLAFETGPPNKDEEFTKFVNKTHDQQLPAARRSITSDYAQHLALTYNMWMYSSTYKN
ncbi:hypothetical protein RFI_02847 [Reticulomyxa filosa]|uniref:Uncharacterized protein n=1 Tax=Reticulomyxa filosa TaxID=46433 RepID=X6P9D7_RETFI|nr:hypothetical protein RFI_02847 [Reticulomyxa filosa]|eukprot:ETO34247.1 hypothetical protein RFI_02847 [Reticulomyxa filosa]